MEKGFRKVVLAKWNRFDPSLREFTNLQFLDNLKRIKMVVSNWAYSK